tara:strand:- start:2033 stop:3073 length:1041 start_codon:yes stop_codon:yes gene_type:complete
MRRHDVDWLRVLALGLLIVYHIVVSFQPWAQFLFFIQNKQSLEWLWIFMGMINIWRIPILFMISGMGVRFAMERRNWKQLLKDRTVRILIPYVFGFFFICPISAYVAMNYLGKEAQYVPNPGHLWFLANIFFYVLLLLPFLTYLKNRPGNFIFRFLRRLFRVPFGIYFMALPLVLEAWLVNPENYPGYALTDHGGWLGMVCFLMGFIFISLKNVFWRAVERVWRSAFAVAFLLYLIRLVLFQLEGEPVVLTAFESMCWMLSIFGCGSLYLNKPSQKLAYFSKAVYPVYIVHMPLQYFFSYYIIPLSIPASMKLIFLLVLTFGGSLVLYEFALKRIKWVRPLFGLRL